MEQRQTLQFKPATDMFGKSLSSEYSSSTEDPAISHEGYDLKKFLSNDGEPNKIPEDEIENMLDQAHSLYHKKHFERAEKIYERILTNKGTHIESMVYIAAINAKNSFRAFEMNALLGHIFKTGELKHESPEVKILCRDTSKIIKHRNFLTAPQFGM